MKLFRATFALCLAGSLASCGGPETPVGQLSVEPASIDLAYGSRVPIELSFTMESALDGLSGDPFVMVHLLSAEGDVLRTWDHLLPQPWAPGGAAEYSVDLYQSAVGSALAAGDYRLTFGLYDGKGRRWPLTTSGEAVDDGEYALATVRASGGEDAVDLRYEGPWLPVEAGSDAQVVGVRWLEGAGSLVFPSAAAGTEVELTLRIFDPAQVPWRLVLNEGESAARVTVASDCGGEARVFEGPGLHRWQTRFDTPAESGACTLTFDPSFVFLEMGSFARRAVRLETLTWGG